MDPFKLGLRSILGITMPGAILVLIFLYVLFSVIYAFPPMSIDFSWCKDQQFLILVILFLVSYVSGSLMRLNASDNVDGKSKEYHLEKYITDSLPLSHFAKLLKLVPFSRQSLKNDKIMESLPNAKQNNEKFKEIKALLDDSNLDGNNLDGNNKDLNLLKVSLDNIPEDFDKWILAKEEFPYPVWQFTKFARYHPHDVLQFFEKYKSHMRHDNDRSRKEFFNYCKMVIYHAGRQLGDAVVEEVHFAESMVRFYAGTYYGLLISMWMLSALFLFQVIVLIVNVKRSSLLVPKIINIIVTITLLIAIYQSMQMILERFRTLRLKEVDTVYDAFYLIHQNVGDSSMKEGAKSKEGP